jgi:hypothetical protein
VKKRLCATITPIMPPEYELPEQDPLDEADKIVNGAFIRGEAEDIGKRILEITGGYREMLDHMRIVNNMYDQYTVEEEVHSLNFLLMAVEEGRARGIFKDDIGRLYVSHHMGVLYNTDGKYPNHMRKESLRILKELLASEELTPKAKEEIEECLKLSANGCWWAIMQIPSLLRHRK